MTPKSRNVDMVIPIIIHMWKAVKIHPPVIWFLNLAKFYQTPYPTMHEKLLICKPMITLSMIERRRIWMQRRNIWPSYVCLVSKVFGNSRILGLSSERELAVYVINNDTSLQNLFRNFGIFDFFRRNGNWYL